MKAVTIGMTAAYVAAPVIAETAVLAEGGGFGWNISTTRATGAFRQLTIYSRQYGHVLSIGTDAVRGWHIGLGAAAGTTLYHLPEDIGPLLRSIFATVFGTIRLRIARARGKSFLPAALGRFQRRAPELAMLIREAFLRGLSTQQVGRVVSTLSGEVVSARTVSRLIRHLDDAVRQFHQAPLNDEWADLFLDGVSLRLRRPTGRKRVQMLVAYGVRCDGRRELLAFLRSQGESQSAWEGLLGDLYRRGLRGENLELILTDGCAGLAAAIQTVYPRVLHQRCWVHKMRNILEHVRERDYDEVKQGAQAIYRAERGRQAEAELLPWNISSTPSQVPT
jgi:putative transposase